MEIRAATLEDYPALTALEAEVQAIHVEGASHVYRPGGVYSRESCADLFATPGNAVVLAVEGVEAVGYMHYEIRESEETEFTFAQRSLHIHAISVSEAQRRKGYGEALMDYALARASENGVERVTLDVWAFNASALRFYERLGFIPTKIRMAREL